MDKIRVEHKEHAVQISAVVERKKISEWILTHRTQNLLKANKFSFIKSIHLNFFSF